MGSFIEFYVKYHESRTAASPDFARHLIINKLGHAMGRRSIHLIQPSAIRHNMYTCLLGESGNTMKTTAQEILENVDVAEKSMAKDFSPEGLLLGLGEDPEQTLHFGEWSRLLRSMKHGGHMSKFREISNELISCPVDYSKKLVKVTHSIKNPYFSQTVTITPTQFKENVSIEDVEGGYIPRFIIVRGKPVFRARNRLPASTEPDEEIIRKVIEKTYELFGKVDVRFSLTDNALERYNEIDKELKLSKKYKLASAFVARYTNYIIAYADILCLSDLIMDVGIGKYLNIRDIRTLVTNHTNELLDTNDIYDRYETYETYETSDSSKNSKLVQVLGTNGTNGYELCLFETTQENNSVSEFGSKIKGLNVQLRTHYIEKAYELFKNPIEEALHITNDVCSDRFISRVRDILRTFDPIERKWMSRRFKMGTKKLDMAIESLLDSEEINVCKQVAVNGSKKTKSVYCTPEYFKKNHKEGKCPYYKTCAGGKKSLGR